MENSGDIFGEIGVLCQIPQPFTVRTTEISQILRLKRKTLLKIILSSANNGNTIISNFYQVITNLNTTKLKVL